MANYSFKEVIKSSITGTHCTYAKIGVDVPSLFICYLNINYANLSANFISYVGLLLALISGYFVITEEINLAAAFFYFSFLCDFCDGKTSRLQKSSSHYGKKLDMAIDRLIFCTLTITYLIYLNNNNFLAEFYVLLIFSMIFLTYDVLELTLSIVGYRDTIDKIKLSDDELRKLRKTNEILSDQKYFQSLFLIKTWVPSRVACVGFIFILAPLLSFTYIYLIALISLLIRFSWFLYKYFRTN